jgi:putative membrane protein
MRQAERVWLRVAAWLSLSAVALWVLLRGQSDLYIAPNVRWTLWLAVLVAVAIAALDGYAAWLRGSRPPLVRQVLALAHERRALSYGLVFLPFLFGLAIPPAVLGTESVLGNESAISLLAAPAIGAATASTTPLTFNLLQLQDRLQAGALTEGTALQVTGFAVHAPDLPVHTWLLVRFITPHCVAEAHPLGLLVQQTSGAVPPNDAWVTVRGALAEGSDQGHAVALLQTQQIDHIARPLDPYLIY